MPDSDADDELAELRERKLAELQERAAEGTDHDGDGAAAPDEPIHVEGQDHYRELLDAHYVALVDFHAEWCGPCQMLAPVVEELAAETGAAVLKVDIDENQALAGEMGVRGVPTLYVYADGEVVDQQVGVAEKAQLRSMVERAG